MAFKKRVRAAKSAAATKRTASKFVTLQIDPDDYEFAKRFAADNGYFGPEDFLNAILNMELIRSRDAAENPHAASHEDKVLQRIIDRKDAQIDLLKEFLTEALMSRIQREQAHEAEIRGEVHLDGVRYVEDPGGGVWLADDLEDKIPF